MDKISDIDYRFKFKDEIDAKGIIRFYLDKVRLLDDDMIIEFFDCFGMSISDDDLNRTISIDSKNIIMFLARHPEICAFERMMKMIADKAFFLRECPPENKTPKSRFIDMSVLRLDSKKL